MGFLSSKKTAWDESRNDTYGNLTMLVNSDYWGPEAPVPVIRGIINVAGASISLTYNASQDRVVELDRAY